MHHTEKYEKNSLRRFGAALSVRGAENSQQITGIFAGMGTKSRVNSCAVYALKPLARTFYPSLPNPTPSSRMCHTITDLGDSGSLLVGGRTSPDRALSDCWLYHKWTNTWERVDDIPEPRYRHSALRVAENVVLVLGGKRDSHTICCDCLIWRRHSGWTKCTSKIHVGGSQNAFEQGAVNGEELPSIFGAMAANLKSSSPILARGIIAGGISADGVVSRKMWLWELTNFAAMECKTFQDAIDESSRPIISFQLCKEQSWNLEYWSRFGASVTMYQNRVTIVGGIGQDSVPSQGVFVLQETDLGLITPVPIHFTSKQVLPLLVGTSIFAFGHGLLINGGGAVCFSFGTFWNKCCYTLYLGETIQKTQPHSIVKLESQNLDMERSTWEYLSVMIPEAYDAERPAKLAESVLNGNVSILITVPKIQISSPEAFDSAVASRRPLSFHGLDLGPCITLWSSEYLMQRIGHDRQVVVHKSSANRLDFVSKNFEYTTMRFAEFIAAIDRGEKLYLRSLSAENPSQIPADFRRDFPSISSDFRLPPELQYVLDHAHSSPFRISGPVNMWLHYDVMSNVLCQIRGRKRVILFPPNDVGRLNFAPGASSSSIDVFSHLRDGQLPGTHPFEAILEEGDVLFIPSLWLHTTAPLSATSISLNVFFRDLKSGYAVGKDVYGNRDLHAYEKGRQDVAKIARYFSGLPSETRRFYLHRLAQELSQADAPVE